MQDTGREIREKYANVLIKIALEGLLSPFVIIMIRNTGQNLSCFFPLQNPQFSFELF